MTFFLACWSHKVIKLLQKTWNTAHTVMRITFESFCKFETFRTRSKFRVKNGNSTLVLIQKQECRVSKVLGCIKDDRFNRYSFYLATELYPTFKNSDISTNAND